MNALSLYLHLGGQAVKRSMQASRAWQHEHLLAATVEYECKRRGAQQMA